MTNFMENLSNSVETDIEQEALTVNLSIVTTESEKLVDELEKLCEKYSIGKNYFFSFK